MEWESDLHVLEQGMHPTASFRKLPFGIIYPCSRQVPSPRKLRAYHLIAEEVEIEANIT